MIKLTGLYFADDNVQGLQIVGNLAFLADGEVGLDIVDISDPDNPILVGNYDTPGEANKVDVVNNIAYVASGTGGLQIIDISTPDNPTLLGSNPLTVLFGISGLGRGVEVVGDTAFVAAATVGLDIIDVSDPANPTILSNISNPDFAWANNVTVEGNTAFISHTGGMDIINITDVNNPVLLSSYSAINSLDVDIVENTAFIAFENGLDIVDISDLNHPTLIGNYDIDSVKGIEVKDNKAFLTGLFNGLTVLDVSDPTKPILLDDYLFYYADYTTDVNIVDNTAYVSNSLGIEILDISNPVDPTLLSNYNTQRAIQIAVSGNLAFVVNQDVDSYDPETLEDIVLEGGLEIVDISDPAKPIFVSNFESLGNPMMVTIRDNTAFIADMEAGVTIVDISDPTHPTLLSNYDTPGQAYQVELAGNTAFIADDTGGMQILDISDLTHPTLINTFSGANFANNIEVVNNTAFIANGDFMNQLDGQLLIVDISDLSNLSLLGTYNLNGWAFDVDVKDNTAFVANGNTGVEIIDVSVPTNPTLLSNYAPYDPTSVDIYFQYAGVVQIVDDKMFVAYGGGGVHVVDISDPSLPEQLGTYENIPMANDIAVTDNKAFVSTLDSGLRILDVSEYLATNNPPISETIIFGGNGNDNQELSATETNQIAFLGAGNDQINSTLSNNNRLYTGSDNDTILAGENDRIFGGNGDDILDASQGEGGNRLFGGQGNDTLIAGNGNDILVGGQGADKFTIADTNLPTSYNIILDFETGDKVIIKNLNVTFADITISNGEKGAELKIPSLSQEAIAIFPNIDANTLNNVNNFEFS